MSGEASDPAGAVRKSPVATRGPPLPDSLWEKMGKFLEREKEEREKGKRERRAPSAEGKERDNRKVFSSPKKSATSDRIESDESRSDDFAVVASGVAPTGKRKLAEALDEARERDMAKLEESALPAYGDDEADYESQGGSSEIEPEGALGEGEEDLGEESPKARRRVRERAANRQATTGRAADQTHDTKRTVVACVRLALEQCDPEGNGMMPFQIALAINNLGLYRRKDGTAGLGSYGSQMVSASLVKHTDHWKNPDVDFEKVPGDRVRLKREN
ncbi:hypothetical protein HOP50_10g59440 [Chloropicon primus]|uniref:Uncharacterized protein n=1 Tax=Chloropicon primus TaxID=1764295 RepID=A0A5B8MUU5_9CHLO|nr:hypothetical protein A3770_10p59230 [Chloropicon primus]UPR02617.1 hypothetical protein HOP50_10g59440 [Chloropicon primus]|eukprot:QDZ23405.1 hypothetical protein A3770_10p59230 [Chloropicon primus]